MFDRFLAWDLTIQGKYIRNTEFSKIVTSHLRFDFDGIEDLAVIDANDPSDHFRDDNHISQAGFHGGWLFIWRCLLFGLAKFVHQSACMAF